MTYQVINASRKPAEWLAPYGPDITREMHRFCDKFPDDMTPEALFGQIVTGARELWVVLDEKEAFVLFFTTRIAIIPETGKKLATATTLAGKDYRKAFADMNRTLEEYAAEVGADFMQIEGREGHDPMLSKCGFQKHAVVWRKPVKRDV